MKNSIAFIALGSNRGDRLGYIRNAVNNINNDPKCKVEKASPVYETKPYGNKEQENFLNAVIKISTKLNVIELLNFLKSMETELGRTETSKWGPREIDLDILLYDELIYSDEKLTVPHIEIEYRDFVMVPLCDIAPNLVHPALNVKICDICNNVSEKYIIKKIPDKIL
jgi:2-amino-4-hydroxy-6-hydroxymethyldihydropteridine diphosphokinase